MKEITYFVKLIYSHADRTVFSLLLMGRFCSFSYYLTTCLARDVLVKDGSQATQQIDPKRALQALKIKARISRKSKSKV